MNLQDLGMRFYVNQNGEGRWMDPQVAERETRDLTIPRVWHDMTDASDDELASLTQQNPSMPKTSKEKQEDFRARQALLGMKEVRGIYLPEALHPVIKEQAAKLLEQHQKESQRE